MERQKLPKLPFSSSKEQAKKELPCYTLTGQMHCAKGQRLLDLLNMGERFLALTNVEILAAEGTSELGISFLAVNKEQIIYLEGDRLNLLRIGNLVHTEWKVVINLRWPFLFFFVFLFAAAVMLVVMVTGPLSPGYVHWPVVTQLILGVVVIGALLFCWYRYG